MKRISLFMLALMACTLTFAENVKLNGLYFSLGTTTAQLIADQSSDKSVYKAYTEVTIPASVTYNAYTYPVTSIGTSAFEGCSDLQKVTLPASVTVIGTDAFYGCTKLGSVNLEEGLTTINQRAFYNCNLTEITVPSTVTSVGNAAFKGNATTTVVWNPVTCSIGSDESAPFYSTDSKITSFTFGDKVEVVPAYICKNMSKIEEIVLPPSVKSLGQCAFMYCTSLKSINLPKTQKTLPVSFFEGCTALEKIELPETLTTISQDAFYGCIKLSDVTLHEGLTTIAQRAFYNCALKEITVPSTVTSVGNAAFKGNPTTKAVWNPVECTVGTDDSAPFYSTDSKITSFIFGDKVETVPAYLCKNMSKIDTVVLPPSVKSLGQCAFMYCTSLKSINLPKTQKTLPVSFFEGCTALEKIELPETLTTISQDAFYGCTALQTINLPANLTTIGNRAFYNCKALQAIYNYSITPQTITESTIQGVDKKTCILYVPIDYIDLYQAKAVWCDFLNIIGVATDLQFEEQTVQVSYLKQDESLLFMEAQKWDVPHAPRIEGFEFSKWEVLAGDLADGIVLQAVYTKKEATIIERTQAEQNADKFIQRGNVYILRNDVLYDMTGKRVN